MINLREHFRLQEILTGRQRFPIGVELVSTRGTMSEQQTVKARAFAEALTHSPQVDWVSITDNAGGHPQMAPLALGTPILYAGKEVVIHVTCKDLNRHALESQLWLLASQGFRNVLAMTGDYPTMSFEGRAKPVFDLDSVTLLAMIERMNRGLVVRPPTAQAPARTLDATAFYAGAVTNNFKDAEDTLLPQYYKLEKKLAAGAQFIINQIGFSARKCHELAAYLRLRQHGTVPLIGNVYVLTQTVATLFHDQQIPGVTLPTALLEICRKQAASPDKGKGFFREFAAKQLAIYRGLGYAGGYLGGVHSYRDIAAILELEQSFAPDDWKTFAREINFAGEGEFFLFEPDPATGLGQPEQLNRQWLASQQQRQGRNRQVTPLYLISKAFHGLLFERGHGLAPLGAKVCRAARDPQQGPALLRLLERASKSALYGCQDCGDCSLGETQFICPESHCAKNQRNGPCGGSRGQQCEVFDYDCIWARAHARRRYEGTAAELLEHAPVRQNQGLRGTSAWANYWLGADHTAPSVSVPATTPPTTSKDTPT